MQLELKKNKIMNMRRLFIFVTIALLAMAGFAKPRYLRPQYKTMSMTDEARHQTITVTAIEHDILKVDVVPIGAKKSELPSLVEYKEDPLVPAVEVLLGHKTDIEMMNTMTGLRVVLDKQLGSLTVSRDNSYLLTDLCNRDRGIRLMHQPGSRSTAPVSAASRSIWRATRSSTTISRTMAM